MNEMKAYFMVDGTAALDQDQCSRERMAIIIPFPGKQDGREARNVSDKPFRQIKGSLKRVLESSEMFCSLKFEDIGGCAYGMFTRAGVRALTVSCSVVAVASLIFGI